MELNDVQINQKWYDTQMLSLILSIRQWPHEQNWMFKRHLRILISEFNLGCVACGKLTKILPQFRSSHRSCSVEKVLFSCGFCEIYRTPPVTASVSSRWYDARVSKWSKMFCLNISRDIYDKKNILFWELFNFLSAKDFWNFYIFSPHIFKFRWK